MSDTQPEDRLLTAPEVARILGLSEWALRRHLRAGRIPGVLLGATWRVKQSVVTAIMDGRLSVGPDRRDNPASEESDQ
jgi:excisionase family DNA binding protein